MNPLHAPAIAARHPLHAPATPARHPRVLAIHYTFAVQRPWPNWLPSTKKMRTHEVFACALTFAIATVWRKFRDCGIHTNIHTYTLYSTLLCSILLYSTLLYSTLLCSSLLYSTLLYSTLITLLYSTQLYSTLLCSSLLCSALLCSALPTIPCAATAGD